jgi:hypothetical protein
LGEQVLAPTLGVLAMHISRPVITIVSSPSGNRHSFIVGNENWLNEYIDRRAFDNKTEARSEGRRFTKEYDKEASSIESGDTPPYHIMSTLVDHGHFKSRKRVSENFKSLRS